MEWIVSLRLCYYSGVGLGVGVQYGIWRVDGILLTFPVATAAFDEVADNRTRMPTAAHATRTTVDEVFIMTCRR